MYVSRRAGVGEIWSQLSLGHSIGMFRGCVGWIWHVGDSFW